MLRKSSVQILMIIVGLTAACTDQGSPTAEPGPSSNSPTSTSPTSTSTTSTSPTSTSTTSTSPTSTSPSTADTTTTTTTEPKVEVPTGILAVVPTQNREDPSKNQFQVQMINQTRDRFDVIGVQFVWEGFTTSPTTRDSIIVGGQTIDFPVPFPGAECVGDGTIDTMPDAATAIVKLTLEDGTVQEVPVFDVWHLARKLYLDDCEKQMIESLVTIEWADLHEEDFEGRPVTAGSLRLTRRSSTQTIRITAVSNTIPHEFDAVNGLLNGSIIELAAAETTAETPIRILESRCDPHALAEVKQPYKFIAQVDIGDGILRSYIIYPPREMWIPMRLTADAACVATGQVVFVGDESSSA